MNGTPIANCRAALGLDGSKTRRHTARSYTELIHSSLFPQVTASQVDKHILKAGLSRGEVQKLRTLLLDGVKQRRNGQMRLAHRETDQAIVMADRLHSRQ